MRPLVQICFVLSLLLLLIPKDNYAGEKIQIDNKIEALSQGNYSSKKISYDPDKDVLAVTYEFALMDSVVMAVSKDKGKTWSYYYRYRSTSSANNPSVVTGYNKTFNKNTNYTVFNGFYSEGAKNPIVATFDKGGYDAGDWLAETYVSADSNAWLPSPDLDENGNLYLASFEPYNPASAGDHSSGVFFVKAKDGDMSNAGVNKRLLSSQKLVGVDPQGNPIYEEVYENTDPILDYGTNGTLYIMSLVRDTKSASDKKNPVYWMSNDYGATWSAMQNVPLAGLPLNPAGEVEIQGGYDLVIDKNNNPHFVVQVRRDTTFSTAGQNAYISDSFDNGDLATNPNGTGSGFSTYLQGTAKAEEYDGDLILTGNANWDIASVYTKEAIPFFTEQGAKLTFDITDCNKPDPAGAYRIYLGISSTNECSFPPEAGDRIKGSGGAGLWLLGDGDEPFRWIFYHELNGRKNIAEGKLAAYKGGAPLTITMMLNKNGWNFTASGGEGSGSGVWPAGFWDGKGEAYVGVAAQGGITNLELLLGHFKAEPGVTSTVVYDSFDDGDLDMNPNGSGSGFTAVKQGTAKAEEFDGDLILTGNANWDISSAFSKEKIDFFADGGAKLTYEISECVKPDAAGSYRFYVGLSSANEYSFKVGAGDRPSGVSSCAIRFTGDGAGPFRWIFYHEVNRKRVDIASGKMKSYQGGGPLTVTMVLNNKGWSFNMSGGEADSSGVWPAGFWDGMADAYVATCVEGAISDLALKVSSIKAEVLSTAAIVDDSFDNGALASNPNGVGSGFSTYLQGTAKAEEYDGDLILTGNANWDIASVYTKETLDFFNDDGAKLTFDITDCNKPDPTGSYRVYLGVSSTNECSFPPEAGDRIKGSGGAGLWLLGDGDQPFRWVFYYELNGRKNIAEGALASYKGGAPLTLTMNLNNKGWSFVTSGGQGSGTGVWPAGFWDGKGDAYVGIAAQGGITNLELLVGRFSVEVLQTNGPGGSKVTRQVRDIFDLHLESGNWKATKIANHAATDYFQYKDPHGNVQVATDSKGNLYAMWAGYTKGIGSAVQTDVFLSYSADAGKTWSSKLNLTNTPDIDEAVVNLADKVGDQLHFAYQVVESYEYLHNRYWLGTLYYQNVDNPAKSVLVAGNDDIPREFSLSQNYPNPFNPTTAISFTLPKNENVRLSIYNIKGELVKALLNAKMESGSHLVVWDGRDAAGKAVASGIYLYRFETAGFIRTKKMTYMK